MGILCQILAQQSFIFFPRFVMSLASFDLQRRQQVSLAVLSEELGCCRLLAAYAWTGVALLSHLLVTQLAWFTTPAVLAPYILVHYLMAVAREGHWMIPVKSPLNAAPQPKFHVWHLQWPNLFDTILHSKLLRLAVVALMMTGSQMSDPFLPLFTCKDFSYGGDFVFIPPDSVGPDGNCARRVCKDLPQWLQSDCYEKKLSAPMYLRCLEQRPWWRQGLCNFMAGRTQFASLVQCNTAWSDDFVCKNPVSEGKKGLRFLNLVYALPLLSLVLLLLSDCCSAIGNAICNCTPAKSGMQELIARKVETLRQQDEHSGQENFSLTFNRLKICKDTLLLVADIFSDMNCIYVFYTEKHWWFTGIAVGIFLLSTVQQIGFGAGVFHAAWESLAWGKPSDRFIQLCLTEKTVEAPGSLILQYYTFPFVTNDYWATWSFFASMLLGIYGAVDAAFGITHLDIQPDKERPSYLQLGQA